MIRDDSPFDTERLNSDANIYTVPFGTQGVRPRSSMFLFLFLFLLERELSAVNMRYFAVGGSTTERKV
jgi:hypothetical protein